MGFKTEISKLHYNKEAKGLFFSLLKGCSIFYGIASGLKNKLYDNKILSPKRVDAFVVSVGNLTTGGVGKTPVVAKIAQHFVDNGEQVAIISRGYGAKISNKSVNIVSDGENILLSEEAGDEPSWLAKNVKGACVLTCASRYKAAKFAVEKLGVSKIVLDDGFQHRKFFRNLDIVLIDSEMGFGNENLLPAGPLREGLEAFSRIDKMVVVSKNVNHTRAEKYAKIMGKKLKKPAFVCYSEPDIVYNVFNKNEILQEGLKVVAFSAIGQPKQFYQFLRGFEVVKTVDFDDHHPYNQADIDKLLSYGVETFVTTEKDAEKVKNLDFKNAKVYALKLKTNLDVEALLSD